MISIYGKAKIKRTKSYIPFCIMQIFCFTVLYWFSFFYFTEFSFVILLHFVLFCLISLDKKIFVKNKDVNSKSIKGKIMLSVWCILTIFLLVPFTVMNTNFKALYSVKRYIVTNNRADFNKILPKDLPENTNKYSLKYIPAWQDKSYVKLEIYADDVSDISEIAENIAVSENILDKRSDLRYYNTVSEYYPDDIDNTKIYYLDNNYVYLINEKNGHAYLL